MYILGRSCLFACLLYLQGCDQIANRISGGAESQSPNQAHGVAEKSVGTAKEPLGLQRGPAVNDAMRVQNTAEEEVFLRGSQPPKDVGAVVLPKPTTNISSPTKANATLDTGLGVSVATDGGVLAPRIRLQGDSGVLELKSDQ